MQSPVKKIYITQIFGVNKANYEKFGLQGHNGIDYRAFLPNGERCYEGGKSEVFAPHAGKIIENALDADGFGWYIKIEDSAQGSVLAHLSSQSPCKVGSTVEQGQFIGYQGTTGNSTGIHLHWGWYPIPRNRQNGFNGYENQEGKYQPFTEGGNVSEVNLDRETFEKLVANSTKWDQTVAQLELGTNPATTPFEAAQRVIAGLKSRQTDLQNQLTTATTAKTNAEDQVSRLKLQLLDEAKLQKELLTNEKKRADLAEEAKGQAEARSTVLQGQVDEASKAKGKALEEAATAKVDAQNWETKYKDLLANKAKTLTITERLIVLFTGRIA